MSLPAFKVKYDDEALMENEDDDLYENVRKLKRHQATLKKGAKGYRDIAEHLETIQGIKGSNVDISTSSNNSNNDATPPPPPPKKSVSRKKAAVSSNENSPPPVFRATRKKGSPTSASPPKPAKKLGIAAIFAMATSGKAPVKASAAAPVKASAAPVKASAAAPVKASAAPVKASAAPVKASAVKASAAPAKASAVKASAPPVKASAVKARLPPRSPGALRANAIEAARAMLHRRLPRHTKRRSGSNEAFVPAAPSGSSASPESPEYLLEFPEIIRAPHNPHEPITPAHCGHLTIGFVDDWIAGAVRALRIRGPPEDEARLGRISFREIGVAQKYDHINNSSDGTCLIHAFLMAVSAFYRNLSNVNKGILGRAFRRNIYARLWSPDARINIEPTDYRAVPKRLHLGRKMQIITMPDGTQRLGNQHNVPRRRYTEYIGDIALPRRHGYLYDSDAEKLAQCFNVNIVLVPPQILNIRYYEDDSAAGRAKPNIILRQNGEHFTTLHLGEQFIFSREEILPILEGVNAARNANAAGMSVADRARYAIGRRVHVVGHPEERIIQDILWSGEGAPAGQAVRMSHVFLENGTAAGQKVPVANIRIP